MSLYKISLCFLLTIFSCAGSPSPASNNSLQKHLNFVRIQNEPKSTIHTLHSNIQKTTLAGICQAKIQRENSKPRNVDNKPFSAQQEILKKDYEKSFENTISCALRYRNNYNKLNKAQFITSLQETIRIFHVLNPNLSKDSLASFTNMLLGDIHQRTNFAAQEFQKIEECDILPFVKSLTQQAQQPIIPETAHANSPQQTGLHETDLRALRTHYQKQVQSDHVLSNPELASRYQQRITALQETLAQNNTQFDYSRQVEKVSDTSMGAQVFNNCYGTALDKQLHNELCETRTTMLHLQTDHKYNPHVQTFAPIVYRMTSLAKEEPNKLVAFNLADFSAALTGALAQTIELGHRMIEGIKTSLSPEHWKDMAVGSVHLGVFLVNEFARYQQVDDLFLSFSSDTSNNNSIHAYEQQRRAQMQTIKDHARASLKKIKKMSWHELAGAATEISSTLLADLITLKLVGSFAGKAGNAFKTLLAELKPANAVAQESFAHVAAGTKLVLEEGVEATKSITDMAKNSYKQTGGRLTAYKQIMLEEKIAAEAYEAIRKSTCDIQKIVKNTGIPEYKISRIKQHVFYDDTHILSHGRGTGRFDPDLKIGEAWTRLENGTFTPNDIKLIEHEYFESKFEKIFNVTAEKAHDAAKKTKDKGFLDRDWIPE